MKHVVVVLLIFGVILAGGCSKETPLGPDGGTAGGNLQWTQVNTGLTNTIVQALVFKDSTLYAGTYGGGVFKSTNYGNNWEATSLTSSAVHSLAVVPNPAGGTSLFAGVTISGTFRTSDNGANWDYSGLNNNNIWSLAFIGDNLYAAGTRIYHSSNHGASWTAIGLTNLGYRVLARSGTVLYAGGSGNVAATTNNGTTWLNAGTGLPSATVESLIARDTLLFAGLFMKGGYRSTNAGLSWSAMAGLPSDATASFGIAGNRIFANSAGLYQSTDNGSTWTSLNDRLGELTVGGKCITGSPDGTYLFVGGSYRVFRAKIGS